MHLILNDSAISFEPKYVGMWCSDKDIEIRNFSGGSEQFCVKYAKKQ